MANRVVLTGIGVISPIGSGKDAFWEALLAGKNGIERITRFDASECASQIAGEVKDFNPEDFIDKKEVKRMDRYTQFAVAASKMAVEDAGLDLASEDRDRIGTYIGSGVGGIDTLHSQYKKLFDKGPHFVSPFFIPMMIGNMAAGQTSIALDVHGPSCDIVTACATGTDCIGSAFRVLQYGEADVMIAGGTEAGISAAPVAGFSSMKALCTDHNDDPAHASRPFDKNRSGFVMGEGAGVVILETLEHAKKRGAHIYAEVVGYGRNSDAYHVTSPAPHGVYQAKCMSLAIADAGLSPDDIDYVNAHGTSTHMNDQGESEACKTVFGARAKEVPISSVKSMTGHMLGAAGGVECIATALTVENDMLPPTINYDEPDLEEGLDLDYVPNVSRKHTVRAAISNNFGFGGHNACIVLKKYAE
ncbi:MAG: beta-ketoacyl-ACP synthase II [Schwartzia sp.]|nr:beta-ketoacyl-ACP synthase II [Schwartzia sp. (in: firmicutes)]